MLACISASSACARSRALDGLDSSKVSYWSPRNRANSCNIVCICKAWSVAARSPKGDGQADAVTCCILFGVYKSFSAQQLPVRWGRQTAGCCLALAGEAGEQAVTRFAMDCINGSVAERRRRRR